MQDGTPVGGRTGTAPHSKRRACRFCEAPIWPKPLKKDFRKVREWKKQIRGKKKFRVDWLIRFRPRRKVQDEMWRLNIPAARAAVRGKFGRGVLLGQAFKQCVALVSLMLKGCGSLDLVLITKSGDVAIGECKLRGRRTGLANQVERYRKGVIAAAARGRLWQEIERSYGRYEFQHLCETARRHFGLSDTAMWCARVERNARAGHLKTFVLLGDEEVRGTIKVDGGRPRVITV